VVIVVLLHLEIILYAPEGGSACGFEKPHYPSGLQRDGKLCFQGFDLSQSPDVPLTGSYELDAGGIVATFRPAGGLNESTRYTINVNGQRDASGNVQTQAFVTLFTTQDRTAPVIDPLPIDGTRVRVFKPTITATYHDNISGVKTSSVVFTLDGISVTQNAIVTGSLVSFTPAIPLAGGHHTVTVEVADNAGNWR